MKAIHTALSIHKPEESLLMVECGGDKRESYDQLGRTKDINLSQSLFQTRSFQYGDMIWNNDFYTINQRNSLIGLFVLSWSEVTKIFRFSLWPLVLPPIQLASQGPLTHDELLRIQNDLCYGLNLKFNAGNTEAYIPYDPTDYLLAPTFWDSLGRYTTEYYENPMFTDREPPLRWGIYNGHLTLVDIGLQDMVLREPTPPHAWKSYGKYHFAFNLITLDYTFFNNTNYWERTDGRFYSSNPSQRPLLNLCMFNTENGWIGAGPDVFGFGNLDLKRNIYIDDYPPPTNFDVFSYLNPNNQTIPTQLSTYAEFEQYAYQLKLKTHVLIGPRICSLIPSRFYTIHSDHLTQRQRELYVSNNKTMNNTIDIIFIGLRDKNTNQLNDNRAQFSKMFHAESPTLNIEHVREKTVIDFTIRDEFDYPIRTLNLNNPADIAYNYTTTHTDNIRGGGSLSAPAFYLPLNPQPVLNPNGETCFMFQRLVQNYMWGNTPVLTMIQPATNNESLAGAPPSSFVFHFGKLYA